ncbi:hypothetical protein BDY21DRAFT_375168 [Lineolata rhizophorae]|uniref:Uncharacterized protein n=1 Tax=Lineolata rhizophorae TaxID=578093 RepID=A0A6A6NMT6_9PEZI|nr:hypothetical protein BDY21DRAFT_375168 [Lineolata rhizophorae]
MRGTAKAIKQNKRLKKFARGTGITHVNKQVKKAWRNAAIQVDVATNAKFQGEVKIAQSGQALVLEDADDGYDGGYVVEYEDGSVEVIGGNQSDGRSKHHMQQAQMTYRSGAQPQSTTSLVHGGTQAQQGVQIAYQSGNQTQLTGQFAYQGQQHTQQVAQVEYQSGQAAGVAGQFTYHNEQQQHAAQLAFRSSQPEDQKPQATDRQQSSSPNSLTANLQLSLGGSGSAEKSQGQLQSNAAIPHQQRSVQSYNRPRSGSSSSGSSIDASELGARDSASVRGAYVGTGGNGYVGYGHSAQADQQQPVYVNMGPQIYIAIAEGTRYMIVPDAPDWST